MLTELNDKFAHIHAETVQALTEAQDVETVTELLSNYIAILQIHTDAQLQLAQQY